MFAKPTKKIKNLESPEIDALFSFNRIFSGNGRLLEGTPLQRYREMTLV